MSNTISTKEYIFLILSSTIFILFSKDFFFFHDNITQLSIPANYYYSTNFDRLYPPSEIITGHQPFFAMYLALGWKIFGKSIEVSHFLMLPFVIGFIIKLLELIRYLESRRLYSYYILAICILDSGVISQLSLITFEITQMFFFIATINSILKKENRKVAFYFVGLCIFSGLRATISGLGIISFCVLYEIFTIHKITLKNYLKFLPGVLLFILFLATFYYKQGWIIHNTVSNEWAQSSERADFSTFIRNIIIFGWRLLDFGRITLWIFLIYIVWRCFRKNIIHNMNENYRKNSFILILILLTQMAVIFCATVPTKNFIGHIYLLPTTTILSISVCYFAINLFKSPKISLNIILLSLISGYFWVYPEKIAKGWVSMPAHWTYYEQRNAAIEFLNRKNISKSDVSTSFPNLANEEYISLSKDEENFKNIDLKTDKFILYSNIFNESDEVINQIHNNFTPIFYSKKGFVFVGVYQRK